MKRKILSVIMAIMMLCQLVMPVMATDGTTECAHVYEDVSILKTGTCETSGIKKVRCTVCEEVTYISYYGHTYVETVVDATCEAPAMVGPVCSNCGAQDGDMSPVAGSEALGHDYTIEIIEATCTDPQQVLYDCNRCDNTKTEVTGLVNALGHVWDEGKVTAPTCTEGGYTTYTCTREGCEVTEDRDIVDATGHGYENKVTDPTCKDDGYTQAICSFCGDALEKTYWEDADEDLHDWAFGEIIKAFTCTEDGLVETVCAVCETKGEDQVVSAAHTMDENGYCSACETQVYAAKIGDTFYETLNDAIASVESVDAKGGTALPEATTIVLLTDVANGSFDLGNSSGTQAKNISLDLNGNNLTLDPPVGSTGTVTNGLRVLAYSQLSISNGTVNCGNDNNVKVGMANYGSLKLDSVTVKSGNQTIYTINNRGDLTLSGNTTVANGQVIDEGYDVGDYVAITNDPYNYYYTDTDASITCESADVIVGNIQLETYGNAANEGDVVLDINAGSFGQVYTPTAGESNTTVDSAITGGTFAGDPGDAVSGDYHVVEIEDGKYALEEHTYADEYKEATCTTAAAAGSFCSVCGKLEPGTTATTFGEALDHDKQEETIYTYCDEVQVKITCSRCDYTDVVTSPLDGEHGETESTVIPAACTERGYTSVTCLTCGYQWKKDETAALNHNYVESVVASTCQAQGYTEMICSVCGDKYVVDGSETEIVDTAHVWKIGTVLKEVTCNTAGIAKEVCSLCGTEGKYVSTPAAHTIDENGYCTACSTQIYAAKIGDTFYETLNDAIASVESVDAKGGTALPEATTIVLLTDVANGSFDLGNSSGTQAKNINLDLNNNNLTLDPPVGSTGTVTNGLRVLAYSQLSISNGTVNCGNDNNVKVGMANYGSLTLDNVDVNSGNQTVYTINNRGDLTLSGTTSVEDGQVIDEGYNVGPVAITNDPYNYYYTDTDASINCDSANVIVGNIQLETYGNKTNTGDVVLNISDGSFGEVYTPAAEESETTVGSAITGGTFAGDPGDAVSGDYHAVQNEDGSYGFELHTFEESVVDATCKDPTKVVIACECGAVKSTETVGAALGHTPGEEQYTAPTCTENGKTVIKCTVCGEIITEDSDDLAPMTGHTEVIDAEVAPTCTATGWTEGKHCSVCGEVIVAQEVIEMVEHSNADSTVDENVVAATCVADGSHDVVSYCAVCGFEMYRATITDERDPDAHNYVLIDSLKDATCEATGIGKYTCQNEGCGVSEYRTIEITHQWDDGVVTKDATCTEAGETTYTCTVEGCGTTKTEEIAATGHTYTEEITKDATCGEDGVKTYTCACGDTYTEAIPATGEHDFQEDYIDATCEENQKAGTVCSVCKAADGELQEIPGTATGHNMVLDTEHEDYVAATCETAGTNVYVCANGCDEIKTEPVDAIGHAWIDIESVEADCENPAGAKQECENCGETRVEAFTGDLAEAAKGHTEVIDEAIAPTCNDTGLSEGSHCSVCNKVLIEQSVVPVLEHIAANEAVVENEVAGTCSTKGSYEEVVYCTLCETAISRKTIETDSNANNHNYTLTNTLKDATCEATGIGKYTCACGASEYRTIESGHKWGEPVVTEATCTVDGETTYTCTAEGCGETKTEVIAATGHTATESVRENEVAASCGDGSYEEVTYCACGEEMTRETKTIEGTGDHQYVESYTDATCDSPAMVGLTCSVCAYMKDPVEVEGSEALGHDMALNTADPAYKAATCTEGGFDTYTCSRCDFTESEVTIALDHDWDDGVHVDASCETAAGFKQTCQYGCGETKFTAYEGELAEDQLPCTPVDDGNYAATCKDTGWENRTICSVCGKVLTEGNLIDVIADAHVEKLVGTLKEATCTESGIGKYACEHCETSMGYKTIAAGHALDEGVVMTPATCGENGVMLYTCANCDYTEDQIIAATGEHTYEVKIIEATCTDPEKVGEICSACGAEGETKEVENSAALDHDMQLNTADPAYKAATCTEGGLDTLKCSRCDYTATEETEALGHQWGNEVEVEATCTTPSGVKKTCLNDGCGAIEIDAIDGVQTPAFGHTAVAVEDVAATCTTTGLTGKTVCSVCGETVDEGTVQPTVADAHVATLDHALKEATCSATGIGKYVCELCAADLGYKTIPVKEHTWNDGEVTTEATCTAEGVKTFTCQAEGCGETKTEAIEKLSHSWSNEILSDDDSAVYRFCTVCDTTEVLQSFGDGELTHTHTYTDSIVVTAPTCTENGYTTYTCACGYSYTGDETEAGHTPAEEAVVENRVEATCEATGSYDLVVYCTVCEKEVSREANTIEATGHTEAAVSGKAATCTEAGLTDGVVCSVCDTVLTAQEEIPATGHTEGEAVRENEVAATCGADGSYEEVVYCTVCEDEVSRETKTVAATGEHSWNEGEITTAPTEETEGVKTYTCVNCDETKTESVPKAEHTHDYSEAVTAPTCTVGGYTTYTCACGDSYTGNETAATGHTEGEAVAENRVEATCTVDGSYDLAVYCTVCEVEVSREANTIAATGAHEWNEGEITTAPTEETEGVKTYTCVNCDETKTESVPKAEHTHDYSEAVTAPTCTVGGYTTYTCACGDSYTGNETAATGHTYTRTVSYSSDWTKLIYTYKCECGDTYTEEVAI